MPMKCIDQIAATPIASEAAMSARHLAAPEVSATRRLKRNAASDPRTEMA